ncbi:hypothetical protein [Caulobacter sp. 17J65-9]|uniref:hypothetical protein n=1 Tax=Caulobacter sp. 17J65-9 TaxID=2709382 RepID=UPI0013C5C602|nr:hypothetical protein [Caulobacter sp. 17J65-9]NEX91907.1 hypothetical protein [Caulobacter sp. 17J65-9]
MPRPGWAFAAWLLVLACLAGAPVQARAGPFADVNEPSRGDPKIYALLARQDFEREVLARGTTLSKVCTIRTAAGRPAYDIYWFYHLTQGASEAHGRSELIVISAAGNVVGSYSYEGDDKPRCVDGEIHPVDRALADDPAPYVTTFPPDQLPSWLGDGGEFYPADRYKDAVRADGIWLPKAREPGFEPVAAPGRHRLPPGYKWGRCLLEVDGKALISGRCSYRIGKGGAFYIAGPRQIFSGRDYPVPELFAGERSRDYWAEVFRDDDGWTGYGNLDVSATHGDRVYGVLERKGACLVNAQVRVCLWRE